MRQQRKIKWWGACLLCIGILVIFLHALYTKRYVISGKTLEQSAIILPKPAKIPDFFSANGNKVLTQPTAPPETSDEYILLNRYDDYLDRLCPRLSAAEEDAIIQQSADKPETKAMLAIMGSSRAEVFISEALNADDPSDIVYLAALSSDFKSVNRLDIAAKLGGRLGGLHAAIEAIHGKGDINAILKNLIGSIATAADFDSSIKQTLSAKESIYVSVGREPFGAKARVLLEERGQPESVVLMQLEKDFASYNSQLEPAQREQLLALILENTQTAQLSNTFDLGSSSGLRFLEVKLLKQLKEICGSDVSQYLNTSISEAIQQANDERDDMYRSLLFARDKPGIFQRLDTGEQESLLKDIEESGEIRAFAALTLKRPDIFNDPNFAPEGVSSKDWALENRK